MCSNHSKVEFGEFILEESLNGWGNCVKWSPNGQTLSVVSQANNVHLIKFDDKGELTKHKKSQIMYLPLTQCFYNGEDELIATGFDNVPFKFKLNGANW